MKRDTIAKIVPYAGLILVVALFATLTGGKTLSPNNLKMILEQSILTMVGGIGVIFVLSIGGLDFSQGSILGIGCILVASLSFKSIPLAVVVTLVACSAIGVINGILNSKFKIPSFVATICVMYIFRGLTSYLTRESSIQVPPVMYSYDKLEMKLPILITVILIGFILFRYTKFGKQTRAIGSGEIAARYSGISVNKVKILAFTLAGLTAGIAACMNIIRVGTATANTGALFETDIMIALVLGGMPITGGAKSRYSAVMVGAFMLAILANGLVMLGISVEVQQLIKGLIFLGAVLVSMPKSNGKVIK